MYMYVIAVGSGQADCLPWIVTMAILVIFIIILAVGSVCYRYV